MTARTLTLEQIADGLRRWTAGHDDHVRAAVELLIEHDHWLRRQDFRRAAVGESGGVLVVRWSQAREFVTAGARGSSSELAILRFAISLATDEHGLLGLATWGRTAVVRAMTGALVADAQPDVALVLEEQLAGARVMREALLAQFGGDQR